MESPEIYPHNYACFNKGSKIIQRKKEKDNLNKSPWNNWTCISKK